MAEAVDEQANPMRQRVSPYQRWEEAEGVPLYRTPYIADLYNLELAPWKRVGQDGAIVNLADQEQDDAWVIEIKPRGQTEVLHHLFEMSVLVVDGRGATSIWQEGKPKQTVEWQKGTVFAPPLNCYYQHYNLDGDRPARIFCVTNAPMVMNIYRDTEFFFNDKTPVTSRYAGEEDFFTRPDEKVSRNAWKTNLIADIRSFGLDSAPGRGADGFLTNFQLSNNQMAVHCSEFPPGTYKKAHRHNVGAHVIILGGVGFSLLWFEGQERMKVDWKDGSVLSPREMEYHQHFNTGPGSARYLAMRLGQLDARSYGGFAPQQIEYEDEDPAIYELYEDECASQGAKVVLPRPNYNKK